MIKLSSRNSVNIYMSVYIYVCVCVCVCVCINHFLGFPSNHFIHVWCVRGKTSILGFLWIHLTIHTDLWALALYRYHGHLRGDNLLLWSIAQDNAVIIKLAVIVWASYFGLLKDDLLLGYKSKIKPHYLHPLIHRQNYTPIFWLRTWVHI